MYIFSSNAGSCDTTKAVQVDMSVGEHINFMHQHQYIGALERRDFDKKWPFLGTTRVFQSNGSECILQEALVRYETMIMIPLGGIAVLT